MESISATHPSYYFNLHIPNSIKSLMRNSVKEISYVFLPEDTTRSDAHRHNTSFRVEKSNTRNTFKTLVWVTIAIATPILLGQ